MTGAGGVEAAGAVEAAAGEAAAGEAAEAEAEGGPAVAVSPEAAVAVVPGQAEETSPDQGEAVPPDHLPLPEVLIVPVWSVLAPGVPQVSNEEMAVEFLPETRFHAIGLPGNAWLTARLNYPRPGGSTLPASNCPRPGPGLGQGFANGPGPRHGQVSPIGPGPGRCQ